MQTTGEYISKKLFGIVMTGRRFRNVSPGRQYQSIFAGAGIYDRLLAIALYRVKINIDRSMPWCYNKTHSLYISSLFG